MGGVRIGLLDQAGGAGVGAVELGGERVEQAREHGVAAARPSSAGGQQRLELSAVGTGGQSGRATAQVEGDGEVRGHGGIAADEVCRDEDLAGHGQVREIHRRTGAAVEQRQRDGLGSAIGIGVDGTDEIPYHGARRHPGIGLVAVIGDLNRQRLVLEPQGPAQIAPSRRRELRSADQIAAVRRVAELDHDAPRGGDQAHEEHIGLPARREQRGGQRRGRPPGLHAAVDDGDSGAADIRGGASPPPYAGRAVGADGRIFVENRPARHVSRYRGRG